MEIKVIEEREMWDDFIKQQALISGAFLQTWDWGEFQHSVGKEVKRFGCYDHDRLVGILQAIRFSLPFKNHYFFCPRGPIFIPEVFENEELFKSVMQQIKEELGGLFFRFEPLKFFAKFPHTKKSLDLHPQHTLLLNLQKTEQELLSGMHEKTRYNIGLAQRRGLKIRFSSLPEDFENLWFLFEKTAGRGEFRLHEKTYYRNLLTVLSKGQQARAFLAFVFFEDKPITANIMVDCFKTRTYLHGASDHDYRQHMAPFLLHWKLIQDAKEKKITWYDWHGIAPEGAIDHPWQGITRFKKGFGGQVFSFPGTYDYVFDPLWYTIYKGVRFLKRKGNT